MLKHPGLPRQSECSALQLLREHPEEVFEVRRERGEIVEHDAEPHLKLPRQQRDALPQHFRTGAPHRRRRGRSQEEQEEARAASASRWEARTRHFSHEG